MNVIKLTFLLICQAHRISPRGFYIKTRITGHLNRREDERQYRAISRCQRELLSIRIHQLRRSLKQQSSTMVYHWESIKHLCMDEHASNWIINTNFWILDSIAKQEKISVSKLLRLGCRYTRHTSVPFQHFGDYIFIDNDGHIQFIDIGATHARSTHHSSIDPLTTERVESNNNNHTNILINRHDKNKDNITNNQHNNNNNNVEINHNEIIDLPPRPKRPRRRRTTSNRDIQRIAPHQLAPPSAVPEPPTDLHIQLEIHRHLANVQNEPIDPHNKSDSGLIIESATIKSNTDSNRVRIRGCIRSTSNASHCILPTICTIRTNEQIDPSHTEPIIGSASDRDSDSDSDPDSDSDINMGNIDSSISIHDTQITECNPSFPSNDPSQNTNPMPQTSRTDRSYNNVASRHHKSPRGRGTMNSTEGISWVSGNNHDKTNNPDTIVENTAEEKNAPTIEPDNDDSVMLYNGLHKTPMGVPIHDNPNKTSPPPPPPPPSSDTNSNHPNINITNQLEDRIALYKSTHLRTLPHNHTIDPMELRINTILINKALRNTPHFQQLQIELDWIKRINNIINVESRNIPSDDPLNFINDFMSEIIWFSMRQRHKQAHILACRALAQYILQKTTMEVDAAFNYIMDSWRIYTNQPLNILIKRFTDKFQTHLDIIESALITIRHQTALNKQIHTTKQHFLNRNSRLNNKKWHNSNHRHPIRLLTISDKDLIPHRNKKQRLKRYHRTLKRLKLSNASRRRAVAADKRLIDKYVKPREPFIYTKQPIALNRNERLVLSCHPKFIPYPEAPDFAQYGHAIKSFVNQMRYRYMEATRIWKRKAKSKEQLQLEEEAKIGKFLEEQYGFPPLPYLKSTSKGMKKQPNHTLEAALSFLEHAILKKENWLVERIDKLSQRIRLGIKSLRRRVLNGEFVLVLGDKSNRLGIMDCDDYIKGTTTFLSQCNFKRVSVDTSIQNIKQLQQFKDAHIGSTFWRKYLEPTTPLSEHYNPGNCYGLCKDHKDGQIKPIRGICSTIGTSIEYTCKWLAYWLKAVQFESQHLLIDMNHFQHMIQLWNADPGIDWNTDHESLHLATWDVKCMYGSIDTKYGNETNTRLADEFYVDVRNTIASTFNNNTFIPTKEAFKKALDIVMDHNLVEFRDSFWLQDNGGAMGPAHTPPWADIAMIPLIFKANQLLRDIIIRNGLKIYRDDLICIWRGHLNLADKITNTLNSINPRIQFECEVDANLQFGKESHYLNSTVGITNRGIESKHYIKPMKCTNPLPPTSHHHASTFKALPDTLLSQIRIISDDPYVQPSLTRASLELLKEGYPRNNVFRAWRKFSAMSKMDLLYPSRDRYNLPTIRRQYNLGDKDPYRLYERQRLNQSRIHQLKYPNMANKWRSKHEKARLFFNVNNVQLILKFHPNLPDIKAIFGEMIRILHSDPKIMGPNGYLKEDMMEVHYKRDRNIRELLPIGIVGQGFHTIPNTIEEDAAEEEEKASEPYIGSEVHKYMMHSSSHCDPIHQNTNIITIDSDTDTDSDEDSDMESGRNTTTRTAPASLNPKAPTNNNATTATTTATTVFEKNDIRGFFTPINNTTNAATATATSNLNHNTNDCNSSRSKREHRPNATAPSHSTTTHIRNGCHQIYDGR